MSCTSKTDFEKYLIEKSDSNSDLTLIFNQVNDTCKTSSCFNKIKINGSLINNIIFIIIPPLRGFISRDKSTYISYQKRNA